MTPKDRKLALAEAEVRVTDLARELGITHTQVSLVISGARRSRRVEEAVAQAIGRPVSKVFPPLRPARRKEVSAA